MKLSRGRSVGPYVRASACPVHCGKTVDRIRMPFGIVGGMGPGMRQGDRKGYFWGKFGTRHCNQWRLHSVRMRQRRDAALFPNYFGQSCCNLSLKCSLVSKITANLTKTSVAAINVDHNLLVFVCNVVPFICLCSAFILALPICWRNKLDIQRMFHPYAVALF